jgi:hypothetical protein
MCKAITIVTVSILVLLSLLVGSCGRQATPAPTPTLVPSPKPVVTLPPARVSTPLPTPVSTPSPKPVPKALSLTTFAAGTTSYVAGLAMGSVLSKYAGIKLAVEPATSPQVGYARMAKGEVELVYGGGTITYGTYTGTFGNPKYSKVRDLFFTYRSNFALLTRGDTGIKSVPDLKGRKVSCIFPAAPANELTMKALLREYGMDFDKDIVAMKYSTIIEMYETLKERRVDATFGTALRINLEEQDRSPGGAYIISVPKEKIIALQKEFPMYFPDTFAAGFPGARAETFSFFFGYGLTSGADVPDDLIYTVVKTIMEHIDEIKPSHAELVDFSLTNFAKYPTTPFHNGAIKYYKEKGLWTRELDDFQRKILEKAK